MPTKKQKLPWNKQFALQWDKYDFPVRPGLELAIYEKAVKQVKKRHKNPKVLILGSTPEFRDLLLKYNIASVCCDINPEVFKALRRLVKRKGREIFIKADWRTFKTPQKFDLIIGHQVFNMLPHYSTNKFIKNVAKNLKPKGIIIHSVLLKPLFRETINPEQGFVRYRALSKVAKKKISFFTVVYPDLSTFLSQGRVYYTPTMVVNKINELRTKDLITKAELMRLTEIVRPGNISVYPMCKNELEQILKQYFIIKKVHILPVKYFNPKYWPIYILQKK